MNNESLETTLYDLILSLDDGEPHKTETGGEIGLAEYHAEIVAKLLANNIDDLKKIL